MAGPGKRKRLELTDDHPVMQASRRLQEVTGMRAISKSMQQAESFQDMLGTDDFMNNGMSAVYGPQMGAPSNSQHSTKSFEEMMGPDPFMSNGMSGIHEPQMRTSSNPQNLPTSFQQMLGPDPFMSNGMSGIHEPQMRTSSNPQNLPNSFQQMMGPDPFMSNGMSGIHEPQMGTSSNPQNLPNSFQQMQGPNNLMSKGMGRTHAPQMLIPSNSQNFAAVQAPPTRDSDWTNWNHWGEILRYESADQMIYELKPNSEYPQLRIKLDVYRHQHTMEPRKIRYSFLVKNSFVQADNSLIRPFDGLLIAHMDIQLDNRMDLRSPWAGNVPHHFAMMGCITPSSVITIESVRVGKEFQMCGIADEMIKAIVTIAQRRNINRLRVEQFRVKGPEPQVDEEDLTRMGFVLLPSVSGGGEPCYYHFNMAMQ